MAKFKKFTQVNQGKIVYFDGIIDGIVLLAVSEIPYVELCSKENNSLARNSAINVKIENHEVNVEVLVKVHYSQSISEIAFKIQESIRHNIEAMTEYRVSGVNVQILGVTFDEPSQPITNENNQQTAITEDVKESETNEN